MKYFPNREINERSILNANKGRSSQRKYAIETHRIPITSKSLFESSIIWNFAEHDYGISLFCVMLQKDCHTEMCVKNKWDFVRFDTKMGLGRTYFDSQLAAI